MKDYTSMPMSGIVRAMEEQSETIMKQADTIYRLSALLLQHCEVTQEELRYAIGVADERGNQTE